MGLQIKSDRVYRDGRLQPGVVCVEGTKITSVDDSTSGCIGGILDLSGLRVLPGLVDTHVHGFAGVDTMDGTPEAICTMSERLLDAGVTSFCPTTVTASVERLTGVLGVIADCAERGVPGAKIVGAYLEGPYIIPAMKGAHPEAFIRDISLAELDAFCEAARGTLRTVLIAPDKEGAVEAVAHLRARGVTVTLGHSNATYEQTMACIQAGARAGVHVYNAMRPLHHREPGILGATLVTDGFGAEAICDGIHVCAQSMQVVTRCKKPEDIVLITDCMCAGGMPDGKYRLGELDVLVENGVARTLEGALAGSTLRLLEGVCNMERLVGVPFETALRFATENPARQLGLEAEIGSLAPGKAADLIAIDDQAAVVFAMVDGKILRSPQACSN